MKLKPEVISASAMSEEKEEDDDEEDEDENGSQRPRRSLLLFQPASAYWSRSAYLKTMTRSEWDLFSTELPSTFVWMLNLISDTVEESPKDLYITLNYLETIIFMRHTKLDHSLTDAKILKHRLVSAMRKDV